MSYENATSAKMVNVQESAFVLLVDGAHGIYAWKRLAQCWPLFLEDGSEISESDRSELMGEDWCEFVSHGSDLYVKDDDDRLWRIEQDGDIWAIHPNANWCEGCGQWTLGESEDDFLTCENC